MAHIKPHIHEYLSPNAESWSTNLRRETVVRKAGVRRETYVCKKLSSWKGTGYKAVVYASAQGRGEDAHKGGRKSRSREHHKAPLPHALAKSESPANLPNRHYQLAYCKFYASAAQSPNFFRRNA